jgi:N-acyl-D-aspartate/D-glutamate deacylase
VVAAASQSTTQTFDVLIRQAQVVDGSGSPWYYADLGIRGDSIVAMGKLGDATAKRVIDAPGLTVVPGFIDMHAHSDYTLLADGRAASKILQGVTTEILGESSSVAPQSQETQKGARRTGPIKTDWTTFREYFDRVIRSGISVNLASYVGSGQVRKVVMGSENRKPSASELSRMDELVEQAMRDGAIGVSSALSYVPNTFMSTAEIVRLCRIAARHGGIYATHLRRQDLEIRDGVLEAIDVGEKAGIPVHIFHYKVKHPEMWGRLSEFSALIDEARTRGLAVTADLYPYIAGVTGLSASMPPRFLEGGTASMLERIKSPEVRAQIRHDIEHGLPEWENEVAEAGGWDRMVISAVQQPENKKWEGKSMLELSRASGKDPVDAMCDLLLSEKGRVAMIQFAAADADLERAIRLPWTAIGSDGTAMHPEHFPWLGKPHPRYYGTYPRVLGRYVREKKLLSFPEAIRKMTSLPAQTLGFLDRGLLRPGMKADVVILDPDRVLDHATFENPQQFPVGIEYVLVNGTVVAEGGRHTGARPGRILRSRD